MSYQPVSFAKPFTLLRDLQEWRKPPVAFWRLSIGDRMLGYASTDEHATAEDAVAQIFADDSRKGIVWDRRPDAIVWHRVGSSDWREPYAVFRWVRDAMQFVKSQPSSTRLEVENHEGRRVRGVTSHGRAILEKTTEEHTRGKVLP